METKNGYHLVKDLYLFFIINIGVYKKLYTNNRICTEIAVQINQHVSRLVNRSVTDHQLITMGVYSMK